MRVLALLLLCLSYKAMAQGGGIQMKIGQNGLNEMIAYLMDNELIPYLQNDLHVHNFETELFGLTILLNRLQLHTLEGQRGEVVIFDGNRISVTVGFSKLVLKANLTRVARDEVDYAPNTVVHFNECKLQVNFSLGAEQNKDGVTLNSCNARIGSFQAEGNLGSALEGAYAFGGEAGVATIVEELCPTLENITHENLNEILSIQDTVSISSSTYGKVSVNMKLWSASTENGFITMKVEVKTGADQFAGGVSFPAYIPKNSNFDVVLLVNEQLLSEDIQLTIQKDIFSNFYFEKVTNEVAYKVQVSDVSVQNRVVSSYQGTTVIWNVTFDVYTNDNCMPYQIKIDSVTPMVFSNNDTLIVVGADMDRLQVEYRVPFWNKSCKQSAKEVKRSKSVQMELMKQTQTEFKKRLKGKNFHFKLPKEKWYGFKELRIQPLKDGIVFSSALRFGTNSLQKEGLKHVYNKQYESEFTSYVYSDGERVEIKVPKRVGAGVLPAYSLSLIVFSISLCICSYIFQN